jgi:P-type conjugative transfer protein TrbL
MPTDANTLDLITNAFVTALQGGLTTLAVYSIPLLAVFSTIAFYTHMWPVVASGSGMIADGLAETLLLLVKFGIFYWLLINLGAVSGAALNTFLQWGLGAGGTVTLETYKQPSLIMDQGFRIAKPLIDFQVGFLQRLVPAFALTLWGYSLGYWAVVLSFFAVALHLMMVIIEYYLAIMCAAVLIPWGVINTTAFFTDFSIGWITGGLVRMLVTTVMVGIATPVLENATIKTTAGNDPTWYGGILIAVVSIVYAILSWVIPGRAAHIAGRGVSLALHAGTVLSAAAGPGRGVLMVTSAIRGVSQLLRRG